MKIIRWFIRPRINYLDCVILGACAGLSPVLGWWVLAIAAAGLYVSSAIDLAVRK
jgi:hypothetical protein